MYTTDQIVAALKAHGFNPSLPFNQIEVNDPNKLGIIINSLPLGSKVIRIGKGGVQMILGQVYTIRRNGLSSDDIFLEEVSDKWNPWKFIPVSWVNVTPKSEIPWL